MWRLFHYSTSINCNFKRLLLLPKTSLNPIRSYFVQPLRNKQECTFTFSTLSKIGFTISTGTAIKLCLLNEVYCKSRRNRLEGYKTYHDKNLTFEWKKLWEYIRPHAWYLIAAILGAFAVAILNIQMPHLMSVLINVVTRFNDTRDSENFFKEMQIPSIKLMSIYIAQSALTAFYINMLTHLGEKMAYNIKKDLFANILRQDISFFDKQKTGEIIARLTSDVQDFKSSFKQVISGGLRAVTQIIGCSITLVIISPQMTLVTLLCVPAVIATGSALGSLLRNTSRRAQAQVEKSTAVADEAVSNIRTVRAFAMEGVEKEMFQNESYLASKLNEQLGLGIGLFQGGANLFLNSMVIVTIYLGGYLLSSNQLTPGQLMAYLMATQTIQRSLTQVSLLFGTVIKGMAAGARVFQFLDLKPKMSLQGGKRITSANLKGEIEFKNVMFYYPTRPQQIILQNFNLKIPSGKTVAVVGGSGNGKSTLAVLIERFYDVNKGSITLDGVDISTLDPSWLRRVALGYISQEPILFATTVMENIRYGRPNASDHEVIEAAQQANAHNFISNFPDGYNTFVGERGTSLSGGQKQRIAIARALLKNPTILILDEATSALDVESEKFVQEALEKAREGRTVLVIAHRMSTIRSADIIVVLDKGKIVEIGNHEELYNLKGYYWSINRQQSNHVHH